MTFTDAGLTDQDEIGLATNKVAAGKFFDLNAVDVRVELPVKGLQ